MANKDEKLLILHIVKLLLLVLIIVIAGMVMPHSSELQKSTIIGVLLLLSGCWGYLLELYIKIEQTASKIRKRRKSAYKTDN